MKGILVLAFLIAVVACLVSSQRSENGNRGAGRSQSGRQRGAGGRSANFGTRRKFQGWRISRQNRRTSATSNRRPENSGGTGIDASQANGSDVSSGGRKKGWIGRGRGWNFLGGALSGLWRLRENNGRGFQRGARLGGPGGIGGFRRRFQGEMRRQGMTGNNWRRKISDTLTVREKAIVNNTGHTIVLVSMDRQLDIENIQSATSAYDFDNNLVAVKTAVDGQRVCILVPTSIVTDFASTVDDVMDRTSTTPISSTSLIGNLIVMKGTEVPDLPVTSPFLDKFCRRRPGEKGVILDATTEVDSMTDLSGTKAVSVLTINGKVIINV